jgi:hypothetical protein
MMNLRRETYPHNLNRGDVLMAYRMGYRDARHDAAELALKADAEIERLRDALRDIASADMTTKGLQMMADEALAQAVDRAA